MIDLTVKILAMQQKYVAKEGEPAKVQLTVKMEVKEGVEDIARLAEVFNYPVDMKIEPVQPGLV